MALPTIVLGTSYTLSLTLMQSVGAEQMPLGGPGNVFLIDMGSGTIFHQVAAGVSVNVPLAWSAAWLRLCIVRSGTSVTFYSNGKILGTPQTLASNPSASLAFIGCRSNLTFFFAGFIDSVAIFPPLTSAQIAADYADSSAMYGKNPPPLGPASPPVNPISLLMQL